MGAKGRSSAYLCPALGVLTARVRPHNEGAAHLGREWRSGTKRIAIQILLEVSGRGRRGTVRAIEGYRIIAHGENESTVYWVETNSCLGHGRFSHQYGRISAIRRDAVSIYM